MSTGAAVSYLPAELVTAGLLGTDRRDPPPRPAGPVADLVADALDPTPAARLLTAVAATVVARRAGLTPAAPRPAPQPPGSDPRPLLPAAAARRWFAVTAEWLVLEPEWLRVATAAGWRPPPDVLVAQLRRVRSASDRRAVLDFGGPVAAWLVDQLPELFPPPGRARAGEVPDEELVVPVELGAAFDRPPAELAALVAGGLSSGTYRWAHREVLVNTVAAAPPGALPALRAALEEGRAEQERLAREGGEPPAPLGLWASLIELADVRHEMLLELEPPDARP